MKNHTEDLLEDTNGCGDLLRLTCVLLMTSSYLHRIDPFGGGVDRSYVGGAPAIHNVVALFDAIFPHSSKTSASSLRV